MEPKNGPMNRSSLSAFILILVLSTGLSSFKSGGENSYRGTIHVKRSEVKRYYINRTNSTVKPVRTIVFRVGGQRFKEYFPEGYTSDVYPVVYLNSGFVVMDENKQPVSQLITGYIYEICKAKVAYGEMIAIGDGWGMFSRIKMLPVGGCVWVKKLSYIDKAGNLQEGKVGEFKIERIS